MKKLFLLFALIVFSTSIEAAQINDNPTFTTTTIDGKKFDLGEKLGKVVIVNFWAGWCIDCRKEIPILEELYKEYHAQGLEIIGVSIDAEKDRQKVSNIAEKLSYPNTMFEDVLKNDFQKPKAIPLNYIFDKKGKLVVILDGDGVKLEKKDFEKVIKPLLKN